MYWIILVIGAILALAYVVVKIRHNQLATADAVFWFVLALVLIIMAIFPQIVYFCLPFWELNRLLISYFCAC